MRIVSAVYVDQGLYFKMILQDCIGRTRFNSDLKLGVSKQIKSFLILRIQIQIW